MTTHFRRVEEIADLIERYLRSHPHAADGVDGVLWWLPEIALEPRALVQEALDGLVARTVAIKRRRDDGTVIYQLRPPATDGGAGG